MTPELRKLSEEAPQGEWELIVVPNYVDFAQIMVRLPDGSVQCVSTEITEKDGALAVAAVNHVRARLAEPEADRATVTELRMTPFSEATPSATSGGPHDPLHTRKRL